MKRGSFQPIKCLKGGAGTEKKGEPRDGSGGGDIGKRRDLRLGEEPEERSEADELEAGDEGPHELEKLRTGFEGTEQAVVLVPPLEGGVDEEGEDVGEMPPPLAIKPYSSQLH